MAEDNVIAKASAVSLLFRPGGRPVADAIRALAQSTGDFAVSLEPVHGGAAQAIGHRRAVRGGPAPEGDVWLELFASGLTFDLHGLAPGTGAMIPQRAHLFGLTPGVLDMPMEAVTVSPGPHLAGGGAMLPVVRYLAWLAARLAVLPGVCAVAWHPARCWSSPEHFRDVVLRWMEGGVFPGFGLAALVPMGDGGLQSEGMALFSDQELRIEPEVAADRAAAAKIALRVMHYMAENGHLQVSERISLSGGDNFRLEPSANGRFVRVWRD